MEATITITMDLSDFKDLESLKKKLDEIEEKRNVPLNEQGDNKVKLGKSYIMELVEMYGIPKKVCLDINPSKSNLDKKISTPYVPWKRGDIEKTADSILKLESSTRRVPIMRDTPDKSKAHKITYERGDDSDPFSPWSKGMFQRKDGNS